MNTNLKSTLSTGLTRRDFLRMTGVTAAAFAMPSFLSGSGYAANPGVTSMSATAQNQVNTDILVIGGGMAGAFAAVSAKEMGLNVTLVDKGTVGRSGATPWANTFSVFDEALGHDRDEWISGVRSSSEYVNNLDWLDQMLDASQDRWDDINAWGLLDEDVRHPSLVLRDKLVDSGVELIERTMLTTLLKEEDGNGDGNGRVIGAMGFSIDSEEAVVVLAKATIMCAGAGSFKAPGFPIQSLTSDGDAMAYRAGAIITGKEWIDFHWTSAETPASCWNQWSGMWDSGIGKTDSVFTSGMTLDSAFAIHTGDTSLAMTGGGPEAGGPPEGDMPEGDRPSGPPPGEEGDGEAPSRPGQSSGEQVLGAATGLGIHKAEGIWPTTMQGACNVPGLFAAGDGLASMLCGSSYVGLGFSLTASATQGVTAGQSAAEYAQQMAAPTLSDDKIASVQTAMFAPRERESGFSPAWVTQVMQNAMFPYFVLFVKQQDRLEAALSTITFLRETMVPRLTAKDAHELRLAHETENMLLNAEMKLRASLFRTESRGTHYREDYPARDDDAWLAWVLLQMDENGQMSVTKEAIPDEWKPDMSVPYEERYLNRFPGELEYLGLA
ncbi:MAG: FAD-binding protein [Chloroflexi bacterium]|nr:MAG: FAD-binding protein [Chloroflexota bacterium]